MALYKQRAIDYLTVATAQTALLQTQLEALSLDTPQLRASVDLIRALGGGWEQSAEAMNSKGIDAKQHGQATPGSKSERTSNHSSVYSKGRSRRCRGQWTGNVRDQRGNFLRSCEAFDKRRRTHLLEELPFQFLG
jgi:hypothetical protein